MRKITQESVKKFIERKPFKKGNMGVVIDNGITYLELHGNRIAALLSDGRMWVSNAAWATNTTKERLNGLPGVNVVQRNWQWVLNGMPWNGKPIFIDKI
jgi:hypothetical protein